MIIENQASVTDAVLEAFSRTADPRLREILAALVRHLHGFVREVRLTEREFQEATRIIAALGQRTTDSHNEVVLMAGSLGVSPLVCLLNNGDNGQTETLASMLGGSGGRCVALLPRRSL
jgi:Catechol dioxygenase N terminus